MLPDGNFAEAGARARAGVCRMVQGAGRPYTHPDFEFAGGQSRSGVRLRHRETFSDRAADHLASFENFARDAVRAFGAARDFHVLSREWELPGRIPARCPAHHGHLRQDGPEQKAQGLMH